MADRHILITGTSRGLGKALAENFLEQGDTVFGCSRSESEIKHSNYHHYQIDIASEDEIATFFLVCDDK
jgi:3-oxoacyl-[acyl-carrier protein] reductase